MQNLYPPVQYPFAFTIPVLLRSPCCNRKQLLCHIRNPIVSKTDSDSSKNTAGGLISNQKSRPGAKRYVFSAGERPIILNTFPPGRLPLAVELDFVLNHPVTDAVVALLVILNCLAFALQTLDVGPLLHQAFKSYEDNVTFLFVFEFFGRWYGKGLSPRFLLTRAMLIDFAAIAPIGFAVADQSEAIFVRIIRLTRILRLQRIIMNTESSREFMERLTNAQARLASVALSLFSLLYVSAGLFYQAEKDVNPAICNFFDAFYFSTITLFTVGFGDVTPSTSWGRLSKFKLIAAATCNCKIKLDANFSFLTIVNATSNGSHCFNRRSTNPFETIGHRAFPESFESSQKPNFRRTCDSDGLFHCDAHRILVQRKCRGKQYAMSTFSVK